MQSNYQFSKLVVAAAILIAILGATMLPASCQVLTGGVEHSDKLAPDKVFQIGTQYNQEKAMASVTPSRVWYRVPPWLAGRWTTDRYTQTLYVDYASGSQDSTSRIHNAELTERWGIQRDRDGGVWDTIDLPFISTTTSPNEVSKDLHTGDALIFDSATKLVVLYKATRTTIDRNTNTITKVQQFESFTTLTLAGPNLVKDEYSLKFFDQQGNPVDFVKGWRYEHKIEPFKIYNFDNGQDSGPDFRAYLTNQGLQNLVPPE
jgi:hypothetical protein